MPSLWPGAITISPTPSLKAALAASSLACMPPVAVPEHIKRSIAAGSSTEGRLRERAPRFKLYLWSHGIAISLAPCGSGSQLSETRAADRIFRDIWRACRMSQKK